MSVLSLHDVSKVFSDGESSVFAVKDVSLEIKRNSITALIGLNGAGKTTLLRLIAEIYQPTNGVIKRHRLFSQGYLSYDTGVYERLTIREYLTFLGKLNGMNTTRITDRIGILSQRFQFDADSKRFLGLLSTGTRQKVAFAGTVLHEPELLLLDEPFSNVDMPAVDAMTECLHEMKYNGSTILFSSHNLYEVEELGDAMVFLHRGELIKWLTKDIKETEFPNMSLKSIYKHLISSE